MTVKKYYSISEAQRILAIPCYKLRYFEKITRKLNIFKIKGRRYYTVENLEFLKNYFFAKKQQNIVETTDLKTELGEDVFNETMPPVYDNILDKINNLIYKFDKLAQGVKSSAN